MSNCLFFALWRLLTRGGYLVIRKSKWGWWPHVLWSADLVSFEEYQPIIPNHHLLLPPPLYHGKVRIVRGGEDA